MRPEQKARNWRYNAFSKILNWGDYDFLLTGHTLSDCVETLLFNLCRGSGLKGVCALKEYQIFKVLNQKNLFFFKITSFPFQSLSSSNSFFFNCFTFYLQNLKKFQKTDPYSSFITFFNPPSSKLPTNEPPLFLNTSIQKLIKKKKKERTLPSISTNFSEVDPKQSRFFFSTILNLLTRQKKKPSDLDWSFFSLKNNIKFLPQNLPCELKFKDMNMVEKKELIILKPLLKINRNTISLFSKQLDLPICYDKSNQDINISRNFIRNIILPLLKKINPQVEKNLYKFSRIAEFYYEQTGDLKCPIERFNIFIP